jgi:hypothetical protein
MTSSPHLINVHPDVPTPLPRRSEHPAHEAAASRLRARPGRALSTPAVRFLLHFGEMQIPMTLGMILFGVVVRQLRTSPALAVAFARGSDLTIITDGVFMAVPMVAWMVYRRHGWRHSLEMAAAMIAPMVAIILLGWFGAYAALPWLPKLACPVSSLGMLAYMLYRRDHFTGTTGHAAHAVQAEGAAEAACH